MARLWPCHSVVMRTLHLISRRHTVAYRVEPCDGAFPTVGTPGQPGHQPGQGSGFTTRYVLTRRAGFAMRVAPPVRRRLVGVILFPMRLALSPRRIRRVIPTFYPIDFQGFECGRRGQTSATSCRSRLDTKRVQIPSRGFGLWDSTRSLLVQPRLAWGASSLATGGTGPMTRSGVGANALGEKLRRAALGRTVMLAEASLG